MNEAPDRAGHPLTDAELGAWIRQAPARPLGTLEMRWKSTQGKEGIFELRADRPLAALLLETLAHEATATMREQQQQDVSGLPAIPQTFEVLLLLREIS